MAKLFTTLIFGIFIVTQPALAIGPDEQWLRLLHFDPEAQKSEIENPSFFIDPQGQIDPNVELTATLRAFRTQQRTTNSNELLLCKYPARAMYLRQLYQDIPDPLQTCPALVQWLGDTQNLSISVVYADGYLGNPASFYGHLLFKLNNGEGRDLLTNSLNFGARVPDNENPVVYILRGLTGGYVAEYSSNHYYRYNLNYAEVEMRDLWDYRLNLSNSEALLVAAHAWEMLFTEYTYYFTHRNCAYHIAKLLEVVIAERLVANSDPFVLPISVFSALADATTSTGETAIAEINRTPSRQARFRHQFNQLSHDEQQQLRAILSGENTAVDFGTLSEEQQIRLIDVGLEYLNFIITLEPQNVHASRLKTELQRSRIKLPPRLIDWGTEDKSLPHTSHHPTTVRASLGYSDEQDAFATLMLRPAFYDLLSSGGGILPNSALSMLATEIRLQRDEIALSSLELLNIETLTLGATGLPGDRGYSWRLTLGNDRNYVNGVVPSNEFFVESGLGKAAQWGNWVWLAQVDGRAQTPNAAGERYYLTPKVSALYENGEFKAVCEFTYPIAVDSSNQRRLRTMCEAKLTGDRDYDMRLKIDNQFSTEVSLSMSLYF
ncbi:DUF4105 domain-containing protein [Alteromonas sp. ASW11-36]|uniref:DUF4105 domain-containing protein n=1 Tax=Alteromonas arenosi TaxID=3055817 RepID=A0ABT7SZY5_9ALTE|nr:DUF4105 domain-containing protein [Alteromonas sp. ASW11-36]MDM7861756.1 DUF4105 domain-containing protein [Alteromonas sp. ASW11-36]